MSFETSLAERVARLETQNRRLKRLGAACAALAGAALLAGAAAPFCKTVWAERLVIRDAQMRDRLTVNAYATDTPTATFTDEKGRTVGRIAWGETMSLTLYDGQGNAAGTLKLDEEGRARFESEGERDTISMR